MVEFDRFVLCLAVVVALFFVSFFLLSFLTFLGMSSSPETSDKSTTISSGIAVKVKGGMALRNGIWNGMRNDMRNDCGMAKRIKFRDIFFVWRFFKFHLESAR